MYSRVLTSVEANTLFISTQTIFIGATQCLNSPSSIPSATPSSSSTMVFSTLPPTAVSMNGVPSCKPSFLSSPLPVPFLSVLFPGSNATSYLRQPTVSPSSISTSSNGATSNAVNDRFVISKVNCFSFLMIIILCCILLIEPYR